MTISNFAAYVKQLWKNKPDTSTPLSAERLTHIEEGIKGNSDAIEEIAAAVVSQIVNDPQKIASMAALYAVNQKVGDTSKLPSGSDVVGAITQLYGDISSKQPKLNQPLYCVDEELSDWNSINRTGWYSGNNAANAPTAGWVSAINIPYNASGSYSCLIATNGIALFIRRKDGNNGWSSWAEMTKK